MKHIRSSLALAALHLPLFVLFRAPAAHAQFGGQPGGMPPGGGMGPQPMGEEPKEEGPAEEAPEEEERPSDLQPLGGYAGQTRRTTQVVQLDGYLRLRTDFLHKLHLGQSYQGMGMEEATPPFPLPLECGKTACDSENLGSGNLRLRLEPTVNVTDQVRVHAQIDVLDNTILGSTPDSLVNYRRPSERSGRAPAASLSNSQDPPELNRNSLISSIRAKRAWGQVDSEFGTLRFGRMPWHFGRGIAFNNGDCPDCDGGTTVDRMMAETQVYGHRVALSWDFGSQGHTAGMIDLGARDPEGPPLDLSQQDDVMQLMAALMRINDDRQFSEKVAQGELVLNYGLQLVMRQQSHELNDLKTPTSPLTREEVASSLTKDVDALVFLPSLWLKLGWKALTLEAEASGVFGKIEKAGTLSVDPNTRLKLRQFGWVVASELRLYKNALSLGIETGGATGDQAEDARQYLNYRWKSVKQPAGDRLMADYRFSPEYHVDEIFFRRILGTVTNAIYVKPQLTYWLDLADRRQVGLTGAFIYSMAPEPVATPGNAISWGVEMDVGVTYRNPGDRFYAGLTWAVFWPMGALDRAKDVGPFKSDEDASSSQALRTFLGIRF